MKHWHGNALCRRSRYGCLDWLNGWSWCGSRGWLCRRLGRKWCISRIGSGRGVRCGGRVLRGGWFRSTCRLRSRYWSLCGCRVGSRHGCAGRVGCGRRQRSGCWHWRVGRIGRGSRLRRGGWLGRVQFDSGWLVAQDRGFLGGESREHARWRRGRPCLFPVRTAAGQQRQQCDDGGRGSKKHDG